MTSRDLIIREVVRGTEDERFVATCSHVGESREIDGCAQRRRLLFERLRADGARFKIAAVNDARVGFIYGVPIERAPWGAVGENLMMIPCLYVERESSGQGLGRALVEAVTADARRAGMGGVAVVAYRELADASWFMPAAFFDASGFVEVERRGSEVLLWTAFDGDALAPTLLRPRWSFQPIAGKVVVDLFWNEFCQTSSVEAQRVREVAREFGNNVVIREYPAEDRRIFLRYQIPRAIYVDGIKIGWGYEAPRDAIRQAIRDAVQQIKLWRL